MDAAEYEYTVQELVKLGGRAEEWRVVFKWTTNEEHNRARFGRLVGSARDGYPMEHIKVLRIVKREVPKEPVIEIIEEVRVRD